MEPQMPRPHVDHSFDEHLPMTEGEDEHHHEKKSVLKKVKAKAKKIKETLTKHGHGHDHDYHQRDHGDDEEEDEDEEMVEDPEVHGAPMYESAAIRSAVAGRQPGVNLEKPTVAAEDGYDSKFTDPPVGNVGRSTAVGVAIVPEVSSFSSSGSYGTKTKGSESTGRFVHRREENMGQSKMKMKMGTPADLEEHPHAAKDCQEMSNYQSKVTDPTGAGGEEAGITPNIQSFKKMNVYDEPESTPKPEGAPKLYTGSHDQFSPEPLPPHTTINPEDPGSALKRFDASKPEEDMPRDTLTKQPSDQTQSGYTEKISSATSAIADKAMAAKNIVASKLGYGGNEEDTASSNTETTSKSGSATEYGHKIAATVTQKLAPVYEKVAVVGSSVISKVHGTGTDTGTGQDGGDKGQDKGVTVKEYFAEKLRPSDEDKALSAVISDALHKRKQEEPEKKVEAEPVGKVTESEEVTRRLGTSGGDVDPNREGAGNASGSSGKAVVDRLKGAVSTWFFRGGQSQTSQASLGTAHGNEGISSSTGEEVGHGQDGFGERRL